MADKLIKLANGIKTPAGWNDVNFAKALYNAAKADREFRPLKGRLSIGKKKELLKPSDRKG